MTAARMAGAILALGSALIALAVGAGSAPWLGVPLLAAGLGQLVIGVVALRGTSAAPALVLVPLIAPTAVWVGVLALSPDPSGALPAWPMLAETGLALVAAALLGRRARSAASSSALPAVLSLLASSAVVAVIASTALAGTEAGRHAVPHGEHGLTVEEHGHH